MFMGLSEVQFGLFHMSDNKIGRLRSDLFITSMITDRIGRHEALLPIYHKNYNFERRRIVNAS